MRDLELSFYIEMPFSFFFFKQSLKVVNTALFLKASLYLK